MDYIELAKMMIDIGIYSIYLPLIFALYLWINKKLDFSGKCITVYLFNSALFSLVEKIFSSLFHQNLVVGKSYRVFAFIILTVFFFSIMGVKQLKKGPFCIIVLWFLFLIIHPIITYTSHSYGGVTRIGNAFFVMMYSLIYLYFIFKNEVDHKLTTHPHFIAVAAFLIYYSVSFFAFLFSDYILTNTQDVLVLTFLFHALGQCLLHLILMYSLYLYLNEKPHLLVKIHSASKFH